jgi:NADPH:quinone reductase-like Zn-dependent oxidoreductase
MLGQFPDGGTALVHGGGSGIGTCAIQLIREVGGRTIVTAGSDAKCAKCRELGADVAVNYNEADFVAAVKEATGGAGADVVLDYIAGPYLERNLQSLAVGGRLVIMGLMGGAKAELNLGLVMMKRLQIIGSTLRARPDEEKAAIVEGFLARFGKALEQGTIGPVVDHVLPLAEAGEAHRRMQQSEHFGKLVPSVAPA